MCRYNDTPGSLFLCHAVMSVQISRGVIERPRMLSLKMGVARQVPRSPPFKHTIDRTEVIGRNKIKMTATKWLFCGTIHYRMTN